MAQVEQAQPGVRPILPWVVAAEMVVLLLQILQAAQPSAVAAEMVVLFLVLASVDPLAQVVKRVLPLQRVQPQQSVVQAETAVRPMDLLVPTAEGVVMQQQIP